MEAIKQVLCVVDPTSEQQPALERGTWVAKKTGAKVRLFICYYNEYLSGGRLFDAPSLEEARGEITRNYENRLEELAAPLSPEDQMLQSMPEASPTKWHLAHTTWFFETFVLERALPGFAPFRPEFRTLFNSYYVGVGPRHPRPERGLLSRPSLEEVLAYRASVDERMQRVFDDARVARLRRTDSRRRQCGRAPSAPGSK